MNKNNQMRFSEEKVEISSKYNDDNFIQDSFPVNYSKIKSIRPDSKNNKNKNKNCIHKRRVTFNAKVDSVCNDSIAQQSVVEKSIASYSANNDCKVNKSQGSCKEQGMCKVLNKILFNESESVTFPSIYGFSSWWTSDELLNVSREIMFVKDSILKVFKDCGLNQIENKGGYFNGDISINTKKDRMDLMEVVDCCYEKIIECLQSNANVAICISMRRIAHMLCQIVDSDEDRYITKGMISKLSFCAIQELMNMSIYDFLKIFYKQGAYHILYKDSHMIIYQYNDADNKNKIYRIAFNQRPPEQRVLEDFSLSSDITYSDTSRILLTCENDDIILNQIKSIETILEHDHDSFRPYEWIYLIDGVFEFSDADQHLIYFPLSNAHDIIRSRMAYMLRMMYAETTHAYIMNGAVNNDLRVFDSLAISNKFGYMTVGYRVSYMEVGISNIINQIRFFSLLNTLDNIDALMLFTMQMFNQHMYGQYQIFMNYFERQINREDDEVIDMLDLVSLDLSKFQKIVSTRLKFNDSRSKKYKCKFSDRYIKNNIINNAMLFKVFLRSKPCTANYFSAISGVSKLCNKRDHMIAAQHPNYNKILDSVYKTIAAVPIVAYLPLLGPGHDNDDIKQFDNDYPMDYSSHPININNYKMLFPNFLLKDTILPELVFTRTWRYKNGMFDKLEFKSIIYDMLHLREVDQLIESKYPDKARHDNNDRADFDRVKLSYDYLAIIRSSLYYVAWESRYFAINSSFDDNEILNFMKDALDKIGKHNFSFGILRDVDLKYEDDINKLISVIYILLVYNFNYTEIKKVNESLSIRELLSIQHVFFSE